MINRQRLYIAIIVTALSLPANADKAKDAYNQGVRAERESQYDAAFGYYKQAYTLTPNQPRYFAAYTRMRFTAATQHVHTGQILRNTGSLTEAVTEFQRAVAIDASNFIAEQELRRTTDMLRRRELQKDTGKTESPLPKLVDTVADPVELQPLSAAPITMHMTVPADVAYKTICKLAGLNVAIDPDFRPQKIQVDLTDVTLRDALETVRMMSKTFWRPIMSNTIYVSSDTAAKRKEIEQNMVRTFYLQNVSTQADLTEAANVVRQMLDVSRIQPLQGQDALIVRGTADQLMLAEKLLADIDKPKPEVVIDVTVMEVSRDKIRTLGTTVPTSTSASYLPGLGAATSTSTGGSSNGSVTIGNFAIAVPGASFTFLASDSNTKILQNPEIRATNNQKSTLKIGDRVPIATGSFQPGIVGGGGVSPLVSTQFQYIDVGVNIDITPHIHSDREVTLKMVLEISSVTGSQNIGGITQPIIGQRRIEHETRLVDGDVNLLGGILEQQETQSLAGYPWLSRLPILKYLFAQDNKERTENEIVFAITPHIVRGQDLNDDNLRMVEVGTGSLTELRHKAPAAPAANANATKASDPAKGSNPAKVSDPAKAADAAKKTADGAKQQAPTPAPVDAAKATRANP